MYARISVVLFLTVLAAFLPIPAPAANTAKAQPGQSEVQVGILLFDGVQIIDFAGPYEVFGAAGFGVVTVSADGQPVTTAMGLKVTPDHAYADMPEVDLLLVPGGEVAEAMRDEALLDFVRTRSASARHTLSVCTGAHILASAGLLDGKQATTFHGAFSAFERMFPKVELLRDQRWVDSGRIITSAGLSSGLDAALHLVSRLHGEARARSVALRLEYDWKPEGGFVRGQMADRLFPRLDAVNWPDGTRFQTLDAIGDLQQWRTRYLVDSSATAEQLLALIATGIDDEAEWQRDSAATVWQRSIEGSNWKLSSATAEAPLGAEGYVLWFKVEPAGG